jgi:hypothetical protein
VTGVVSHSGRARWRVPEVAVPLGDAAGRRGLARMTRAVAGEQGYLDTLNEEQRQVVTAAVGQPVRVLAGPVRCDLARNPNNPITPRSCKLLQLLVQADDLVDARLGRPVHLPYQPPRVTLRIREADEGCVASVSCESGLLHRRRQAASRERGYVGV